MNLRSLCLPGLLATLALHSAAAADLDKEYDQVRTIALRDPKVRAAFEKANQRLEEKIVEIDPALKGYVRNRGNTTPASRPAAPTSAPVKKPLLRTPAAPAKPAPAAKPAGPTHIIATGDTLGSIASRYHVTVAALKRTNPTVDEKRLQVGQKLTIPPAQ